MKAKELIKQWIDAFNRADVDDITALYADNAINHQVANQPAEGKSAIRAMFESEFATAEMVCIPENIFEDGEWAILECATRWGCVAVDFFMWWMIRSCFSVGTGIS